MTTQGGSALSDSSTWVRHEADIRRCRSGIDGDRRLRLEELLGSYRAVKTAMDAVTARVSGAAVCRDCGGLCCMNGKYRLSGMDVLAVLSTGVPLPEPRFERKPDCPYGDEQGCRFIPEFRPASCIQFICEQLESRLSPAETEELERLETVMRGLARECAGLTGLALESPFLLMPKILCPANTA